MVECVRMKVLCAPRVKPKVGSPTRIKLVRTMGAKVAISANGVKGNQSLKVTKQS